MSRERRRGSNGVLAALPPAEYQAIEQYLEPVKVETQQTVAHDREPLEYAYFPHSGLFCLIATGENGHMVEVGIIDNAGVMGGTAVLEERAMPYSVLVQVAGDASRMKWPDFKQCFQQQRVFSRLILRHTYLVLAQVLQSALCNRFHSVEQRLARWILRSQDRTRSDTFRYTHHFLSQILGTDRGSITTAALALKREGALDYRRAQVTVHDRKALEKASCECYRQGESIFADFRRFLESV